MKTVSQKIRWLSIIATFAMIEGHVRGVVDSRTLLHDAIIAPFTSWAVPCFFIISGVFFAVSINKYTYFEFCLRKLNALAVPYLLWLFLVYPLAGKGFSCGEALGLTNVFPAANPTLWYVRQLFLFVIIAGAIWKCLSFLGAQKLKIIMFAFVWTILWCFFIVIKVPFLISATVSPFWFLLGILISSRVQCGNIVLIKRPYLFAIILVIIYAMSFFRVYYHVPIVAFLIRETSSLVVTYTIWSLLNLSSHIRGEPPAVLNVMFFCYCIHWPLLHLLADVYEGPLLFLLPLLCVIIANGIRRLTGPLYAALSGGR